MIFVVIVFTGVSELVMNSDDLPRNYSRRLEEESGSSNRVPNIYPGREYYIINGECSFSTKLLTSRTR